MTSALVLLELRDSVAIVRLNRPQELDALSRVMLDELGGAFRDLEDNPNVRVVILVGAREEAFSAGPHVAEMTAVDNRAAFEASHSGPKVFDQIAKCVVPVIAAVSGVVAGDAFELALACHMRVASTDAKFSVPESKGGMIRVSGGAQRLARIIGSGRAVDIHLNGRTVSAEEALRIGLVNRVTEPESLLSEAETFAREISKLAPLAIRACLESVTKGFELPLPEALAIEAELFSRLFATDDFREGTRAFLEKRRPTFKGR